MIYYKDIIINLDYNLMNHNLFKVIYFLNLEKKLK